MSTAAFPILRITIIGCASVGKTSIINCFVNNSNSLKPSPPSTEWPTLYYKVESIPEEEDSADSNLRSVCIEIEDTYDANRQDEGRNIRSMLDMKRKIMTVPKGVNDFTPFGIWKPPLVPAAATEKYHPVCHGRMGFLLVFDVNVPDTFKRVMELYDDLKEFAQYRNAMLKPLVFLVANKTDVDPSSESVQRLISQAELYAQQVFLRLWKVSAAEGKGIKRMFRDMVYLILGNTMLWELEYEQDSSSSEEETQCAIM